MKLQNIQKGIEIKTNKKLGDTKGFLINKKNLDARTPNSVGTVLNWVPGHGGDVWWIKHQDNSVGAYLFNEFELN